MAEPAVGPGSGPWSRPRGVAGGPAVPVPRSLLTVPRTDQPQTAKDFKSDQEVRWCPGCGDYAILAAVQSFLPELRIPRENLVFVSGIGCAARFPYYLNSYGMHSIHGRAPAIATGLAVTRPDLSVWVVSGDGDALSIGGNHLIHALRRNVNLKILLFNNRIYGLTKGQYSPTSEVGKITKSTPAGSVDTPFNPLALALGAEATFVARTVDSDRKHLTGVLRAAAEHQGTAFVEIYQNCPIFNDGAFDALKDAATRDDWVIRLEHGQPVRFGRDGRLGVVAAGGTGRLRVVENPADDAVIVHDAHDGDPSLAFALARLPEADLRHTPIGVFRAVRRPTFDERMREQIASAQSAGAAKSAGGTGGTDAADTADTADLAALLRGTDTWTVPAPA